MSTSRTTSDTQSIVTGIPDGGVPYVAILAALTSAAVHLWLAPTMMEFNRTTGILFVLAGLGFVGGIAVYLTKYWRRELYLVAIVFALAQIVAWAVFSGELSPLALVAKFAEVVFVIAAAYLYWTNDGERGTARPAA